MGLRDRLSFMLYAIRHPVEDDDDEDTEDNDR